MTLKCDCSGFGELALLYSSPRAASVLAITDCKLWVMERTVYLAIKRTYQEQLAALKRKMVASVPILAVLSEVCVIPYTLCKLSSCLSIGPCSHLLWHACITRFHCPSAESHDLNCVVQCHELETGRKGQLSALN